eukprot:5528861-Prymnesium_polylepis.3
MDRGLFSRQTVLHSAPGSQDSTDCRLAGVIISAHSRVIRAGLAGPAVSEHGGRVECCCFTFGPRPSSTAAVRYDHRISSRQPVPARDGREADFQVRMDVRSPAPPCSTRAPS